MTDHPALPPWLPASSLVAGRIGAVDWERTPMGPSADWPASLRTLVALVIGGRAVMTLLWGTRAIFFCNDAFVEQIDPTAVEAIGRSASMGRHARISKKRWRPCSRAKPFN